MKEKGIWTLLEACRKLSFDYRLILVGRGNLEESLKRALKEQGGHIESNFSPGKNLGVCRIFSPVSTVWFCPR